LYRLDMTLLTGSGNDVHGPRPSYLVRASGPLTAALLAGAAVLDRWPDAREVKVLRMWSYPTDGAMVLWGADHLEPGEPVALEAGR